MSVSSRPHHTTSEADRPVRRRKEEDRFVKRFRFNEPAALIEPTQLFTVRYHHQGTKPVPMPPRELPTPKPVPPKELAPPFQNHMFGEKAVGPNAVVPNGENGEAKPVVGKNPPVVGKNPPVVGKNPPVVGNRATPRLRFMANGLVGNSTVRLNGEKVAFGTKDVGVRNPEFMKPIVLKLCMNGEAPKFGRIIIMLLFIIMGLPAPLCIIIALPPPPIAMRWA